MKRFVIMLLAFALLLGTMSFNVSAVEIEQSGHGALVQKAMSAFPEYAEKLENPKGGAEFISREASIRELLVNETRAISSKEYITYTEYSDGLILLSGYEFTADTTTVNYVTGASSRDITINIEATCVNDVNYDGYFYLNGVSYSLRNSDFDIITNPGTASREGYCTKATRTVFTAQETLTGYARIAYDLCFQLGPTGYYTMNSELLVYVGEDTAIVEHMDRG